MTSPTKLLSQEYDLILYQTTEVNRSWDISAGSALLLLFRQTHYGWTLCSCILCRKLTKCEGKPSLTCMPGLVLGFFSHPEPFWTCCKPNLQPCECCPPPVNIRTISEVIHTCHALTMSQEQWGFPWCESLALGGFSTRWPTLHYQPVLQLFIGKKQSIGQKDICRSLIRE